MESLNEGGKNNEQNFDVPIIKASFKTTVGNNAFPENVDSFTQNVNTLGIFIQFLCIYIKEYYFVLIKGLTA